MSQRINPVTTRVRRLDCGAALRKGAGISILAFTLNACGDDTGSSLGAGGQPNASGAIKVQIGGEELATDGILFPQGSEVTIADGWEIELQHVLVTVANVTLAENPDRSPSDQSQTGRVVAREAGPWAVDLHKEGAAVAAGGEGTAVPLFVFSGQNAKGNAPFDPTQRYAFGYDIVAASGSATRVNFEDDQDAGAAYEEMIEKGYSVLYVGTATFKGKACERGDESYDFERIPVVVPFRLGFATPSSMLNCQNQENEGEAFQGEEYQRGIPIYSNRASVAQITLHVDHPFYSDIHHEPALYFDQFAARLVGNDDEQRVLSMDDVVGVDPMAFTDASGTPLPWRVCDGAALPASAQRAFDVGSVPFDPSSTPSEALRDYRDYVHYVQSTQGHLNGGEGLCFVKRNYPAPP